MRRNGDKIDIHNFILRNINEIVCFCFFSLYFWRNVIKCLNRFLHVLKTTNLSQTFKQKYPAINDKCCPVTENPMKRQLPLVVYITGGTINLKFVFFYKKKY